MFSCNHHRGAEDGGVTMGIASLSRSIIPEPVESVGLEEGGVVGICHLDAQKSQILR